MTTTPTPDDKFTFGLWTVGWQARDPFGDATRAPLDAVEAVHRLAELGAYGVTFHDDDLVPFGSDDAERRASTSSAFKAALDETGMKVPMLTTNLFTHPVFKDGGFTSNDRDDPALRAAQGHAQPRPRRRARRADVRVLGRPRGRRDRLRQGRPGRPRPLPRGPRHPRLRTCIDKGYGLRFAIEPKPNEPRGDILLPTIGHALAFIDSLEHSEMVGVNPEVGHEQMAGLNFVHGIAQALWHGKLFHIDLNGQHGPKYDQDLVFGHGDLLSAFFLVDLLENGGPDGTAAYDGPRHFDYKPLRTEDYDGVWASAAANMRTYLLLKERATAFRADPRGAGRDGGCARSASSSVPTLADGETYADLLADRRAFEDFDADAAGANGHRLRRVSTSSPSSTCSAPADRPVAAAVTLTSSPGSTPRPSRARWSSATPRPARCVREGRARHPDGTEVHPDALVDGARRGGRRRPAGSTTSPASRSAASSTAWSPSTRPARSSGPPCCGTTPGRRHRPSGSSPSRAARRSWADAVGLVPVASFTVTKLRMARRARAGRRGAGRGGLPAARLAHVALWRRRPGAAGLGPDGAGAALGLEGLVTDRGDASGTGYCLGRDGRLPSGPARRGARARRPAAARPRPGRERGHDRVGRAVRRGRRSAPAPATTPPPRSGSVPAPATSSCRSAPRASCLAVAEVPASDPTGHGRRLRRRDRPLPAAGVHAQRRPRARRHGARCSASTSTSSPRSRSPRRPGPTVSSLVPYLEGERTPNRPDATGALHGLRLETIDARRTWPGPPSRVCSAGSPTGSTRSSPTGPGSSGCSWSAAARGRRRCAGSRRRCSAGPSLVPPPGEYVADGAARQAAWVLSAAATSRPPGRSRAPGATRPTPSPAVRARYAEVREMTAVRP